MNSLPLIGKFLGTVIVGPIIERFGHRWTMTFTCGVQIVGPISEFAPYPLGKTASKARLTEAVSSHT